MGSAGQIVYDASGNKFAYMNGQTVQKYVVPLAAGVQAVYNSSGLQYYRHADWLGTSRLQIDTSGNLYGGRAYAPFGETYAEAGTADRSFTGQTQDVISGSQGIYDFLFRQQASSQGRWLVPDPAGLAAVDLTNPQTWNRYAYVANNPLSNVDPQGLDPIGPVITNIRVYGFDPYNIGSSYSGDFGIGGVGDGNPNRLQILPLDGPGEGRGGSRPGPGSQPQPPADSCSGPNPPAPCANAANNAPNRTICAGQALKNNALSLTLDVVGVAAGFIPGGSLAGTAAQTGLQAAAGMGSLITSKNATGAALSFGGLTLTGANPIFQMAELFRAVPSSAVKAIPVLGTVVSGAATLTDAWHTSQDYQNCMAGH